VQYVLNCVESAVKHQPSKQAVCDVVIGRRSSQSRLSCCRLQLLTWNCRAVHVSVWDAIHAACLVLTMAEHAANAPCWILPRSFSGCGLLMLMLHDCRFICHVHLIRWRTRWSLWSGDPSPPDKFFYAFAIRQCHDEGIMVLGYRVVPCIRSSFIRSDIVTTISREQLEQFW